MVETPETCVTAGWVEQSAETGNGHRLLTDDLQDYSAQVQWLDLPFQKKTGLKILQLSSVLKSPPFQWPSKINKQGHSSEFGYSLSLSLGDSSGPISRNFCCICLSSTHSQAEGLGSVVNLCWPTLLQKAERHRLLCIWNSQSLRERHCPDQPLQLSHPQLSHSFIPTL